MAERVEVSLGFEEVGVASALTTARGLAAIPTIGGEQRACIAEIQCDPLVDAGGLGNVAVRFRDDGTNPTVNVGIVLRPGEVYKTATSLAALRFIGVAANAKLNVKYVHFPQTVN